METQEKLEALEALKKRAEFENNLVIKAYEDENFKQQLLSDPRTVYGEELGTEIPDSFNVEVLEEKPDTIYLVLPRKAADEVGAEGELSDEALEAVAGGGWAIGSRRSWVIAWKSSL